MKYQFIKAHRVQFCISVMCRVLGVSRSGYYAWVKRPVSKRKMADVCLSEKIKALFKQGQGTYGVPTIYRLLKKQEVVCSRKRVARLMRENDLVCKTGRRFKVTTTDSKHNLPVAPNLLEQDFSADRPDEKWVSDITYIKTKQGWLYLAVVMDLYSRRIIGWAMSESLHRSIVIKALQMALLSRLPAPGLLLHSDRGSQYASHEYQALLTSNNIRCSMSRKGNCYDNAPMESFFGSLKTERVHHRHYQTKTEAKTDIFEYIEAFYNRTRRHSGLDDFSPDQFEQLVH